MNLKNNLKALNCREYLHLLKFSTANNLLPIETGRYDDIPLGDKKMYSL